MGDAGIASHDDDVIFYGPALVATARGTSGSLERFAPGANGGALSSVTRIGGGGVGIGFSTVDFRAPVNQYPISRDSVAEGGPATGSSTVAVVAVAQSYKKLSVGLAAKYADDHVGPVARSRGALDVGIARDIGLSDESVTAAVAVQNIGRPLDVPGRSTFLPLRATAGASTILPAGPLDIGLAAALSVFPRGGFVVPAGGLEVGYSWLDGYSVAARAGARRPQLGEGVATAGAGIRLDRVSLDYALETLGRARIAHRIGISLR